METLFSSAVGGRRLRERVLRTLREAVGAAPSKQIDLHIMTFSFTDDGIACVLVDLAASHPEITVRIVADWNQGSPEGGRQVARLANLGLPNLLVRYKSDQPYEWDAARGGLRWTYRASRGLLHHKTLSVLVDGSPSTLLCGSFNWTASATSSYENLLVVTAADTGYRELMRSIEWEFEAMWCNGAVTLSPEEARTHYAKILEEFSSNPARPPGSVIGLGEGEGATLRVGNREVGDGDWNDSSELPVSDAGGVLVAFGSRSPQQTAAANGYSHHNRGRRFELRKPGGKVKRVPVTLTTVALDTIARAASGDTLKVAMYGLSPRVPAYGALLDAARRGVRIQILLDGRVGRPVLRQLTALCAREELPVEARAASRTMHQKYIVHPETNTVLTGTANLSADASGRHSEHAILIRHDRAVAAAFLVDFTTIWSRLLDLGDVARSR